VAGGSLTVTGLASGLNVGQLAIGPLSITNTINVGESIYTALSSGDNTFTVPAGAVAALVVPPSGNAVVLKVRTNQNSGDGGLQIASGPLPFVYPFPATAPTSLIINAASSVALGVTIAFI
jgi:hypothetical protein